MSTAAQKKAIKEFRGLCSGASEATATKILSKFNYNIEQAVDHYFQTEGKSSGNGDKSKINKIFDKYADAKDKDSMSGEPIGQFFRDAGVADPEKEGAVTLYAAFRMRCKTLGEIKRSEFVEYYVGASCDTIEKIKADVASGKAQLTDKQKFRDFYRWLFDFIKEEPDRKSVDIEPAMEFLKTVLPPQFPLCTEFVDFLKTQKLKTLSADVWHLLLDFAREVKPDFSNYEVDGAWPVLFDDFVAYVQAEKKKKAGAAAGSAAAAAKK
jgi:DCN1-like protein 1/2